MKERGCGQQGVLKTESNIARWTLEAGIWSLDAVLWTLDVELWTLNSERWTLDVGLWILDATLWTLGSGHWALFRIESEPSLCFSLVKLFKILWVRISEDLMVKLIL